MVAKGRIGCYGVSSNGLGGAADDLSTTSLAKFLEAAQKAGGENHHFKVVQLPFNLLESGAYPHLLQGAQEAGLGVLINRPLNAFMQQTLVRLADFDYEDEELNLGANILALKALEDEFRATFGPFIQGEGVDMLFRFSDNLKGVDATIQNIEHWNQLEAARIRPTLLEQVKALDQAIQGPPAAAWAEWRERFMNQFRNVMNDLEEIALQRSQDLADSVRDLFEEFIPEEQKSATTSKLALWTYANTPGISTILVGMRQIDYVEDVAPVLAWPKLPEVEAIYRACADWRNPNPVLA
jgi:aryl-alcohol dehydrogenase-like predicted oxidoreductase